MNILKNLMNNDQFVIPYWLRLWIFIEWFCNKELNFKLFGCVAVLAIWTFQFSSQGSSHRWLVYSLRGFIVVIAFILAHKQIFFDTAAKIGF